MRVSLPWSQQRKVNIMLHSLIRGNSEAEDVTDVQKKECTSPKEPNGFGRFFKNLSDDFHKFGDNIKMCCGIDRNEKKAEKMKILSPIQPDDRESTGKVEQEDEDLEFVKALEERASQRALGLSLEKEDEAKRPFSPCSSGASSSCSSVPNTPPSNPRELARYYLQSRNRSVEEEEILQKIEQSEEEEYSAFERAMAYENAALYYSVQLSRPWKAVQFYKESWRLYKEAGNVECEVKMLESGVDCMVKSRKIETAIEMCERRSYLLAKSDPIGSNESLQWSLRLKERKSKSNSIRNKIDEISVERTISAHERDPELAIM